MNKGKIIRSKANGEYIYELTQGTAMNEEGEVTDIYGIGIVGNGEHAYLYDIAPDYDRVKFLFELIAEEMAYPVHLKDIAEDFVNEWAMNEKEIIK